MAWRQVQGASQGRFHPLADATALSPSLLPNLSDQGNGQFHGKDALGLWNRLRPTGGLGLLQVAVSLTTRDAIMGDKPAQDLWGRGFELE
jgi:hypothetical protein